jgi:hypothetical protein
MVAIERFLEPNPAHRETYDDLPARNVRQHESLNLA